MRTYEEDDRKFFEEQLISLFSEMYLRLRLKTSEDYIADDLMQITCKKAWESFDHLRDRTKFKSWIFCILNNTLSDYYRNLYREREYLTFSSDPEEDVKNRRNINSYLSGELVIQETASACLIDEEHRNILWQAFEQLSEKQKTLLKLWMLNENSQKEIADITGMNYNTVRTEIHRGLAKLTKIFNDIEKRNGK